jgi:hypothetical protein
MPKTSAYEHIWEKYGFDLCESKTSGANYKKMAQIYFKLIQKELKENFKNNVSVVKKLDSTSDKDVDIVNKNLTGEEQYISNVIKSVNEKYHINEMFEFYGYEKISGTELLTKVEPKKVKNAFYKNMTTKDAISIASNRRLFAVKNELGFRWADNIESTAHAKDHLLFGALREFQEVHKNRGFFWKLFHKNQYREEKNYIHQMKLDICKYIYGETGDPINKYSEIAIDSYSSTDYNRIKFSQEGIDVNFYKQFALKSIMDANSKNNDISVDQKDEIKDDLKEIISEYSNKENTTKSNDTLEDIKESMAKTQIYVNEVKNEINLNNEAIKNIDNTLLKDKVEEKEAMDK